MNPQLYQVGESYRYSSLPSGNTSEYSVIEYGSGYIGQYSIHIRLHSTQTDIWFIWDAQFNEAIFKCVYNN